jgi:Putative redox-active protein (C_GCAxxG_C_C)
MSKTDTTTIIINNKSNPCAEALNSGTKRIYRRRGLDNILKMGHCAPAVIQTLLDLNDSKEDWPVKLTAGLPGGIGNTGYECGGTTATLFQFGLDYGAGKNKYELPEVIVKWHSYSQKFSNYNNSLLCREILGKRRIPLPCIKVVRHVPEFYYQTINETNNEVLTKETKDAFRILYTHMTENNFHCAQTVLRYLDNIIPVNDDLLKGTSGFIGGTAFKGLTCSAFTAGLMAIGLKLGEIEDSYLRVLRMLSVMIAGGNAFENRLNKFNRLMNIGYKMSKWFRNEFGSTLCHEITGCEFSAIEGAQKYVSKNCLKTCKAIAEKVAVHAESVILQNV